MLNTDQSYNLQLLSRRLGLRQLTQAEVSRATGVHQSQISRILAGSARRASKNVQRLCKYAESLPPLEPVENEASDKIISNVRALLGNNAIENQALVQVVASLNAWRRSWEASQ